MALGLRAAGVGVSGFWLDEIFGASYVNLSLTEVFIAVMRFDAHPPLYYLQLKLWSVLGNSDTALIANSIFWSLATVLAVYWGARKYFGAAAGLAAMAACALLGSEIYYSNDLRMYAMISFMTTGGWLLAGRVAQGYGRADIALLVVWLAAMGAVHAAAFIPISAILLYACPLGKWQQVRPFFWRWLLAGALTGLLILPWVINTSLRSTSHFTWAATPELVSLTLGGWLVGNGNPPLPGWILHSASAVVVALALLGLLADARLRKIVLCFVIWPIAFGALFSVLFKPVWVDRLFAFCAPFLAITAGVLISRARDWMRMRSRGGWLPGLLAVMAMAALLAGVDYHESQLRHKMQYREAAQYLKDNVQPGEVIQVPDRFTFWGIARYTVGPSWGSLMKVQSADSADLSPAWARIYARLGPEWLKTLGLVPETRRLQFDSRFLYVGASPIAEAKTARRVWMVSAVGTSATRPADLSLCPARSIDRIAFRGVDVYRINCQ
jgi:uncharacterized membrane protein